MRWACGFYFKTISVWFSQLSLRGYPVQEDCTLYCTAVTKVQRKQKYEHPKELTWTNLEGIVGQSRDFSPLFPNSSWATKDWPNSDMLTTHSGQEIFRIFSPWLDYTNNDHIFNFQFLDMDSPNTWFANTDRSIWSPFTPQFSPIMTIFHCWMVRSIAGFSQYCHNKSIGDDTRIWLKFKIEFPTKSREPESRRRHLMFPGGISNV